MNTHTTNTHEKKKTANGDKGCKLQYTEINVWLHKNHFLEVFKFESMPTIRKEISEH